MYTKGNANDHFASDLVKGALAGAAATWVMGRVASYLYRQESRKAKKAEVQAREGKRSYGLAAEKAAKATTGQDLSKNQRKKAGRQLHWALGIGAGTVYGALRGRVREVGWGRGFAFGTGFYLLVDEGANPALGLTPGPTDFPWQAHARGLAAHLVFGVVVDATLNLLDRVA